MNAPGQKIAMQLAKTAVFPLRLSLIATPGNPGFGNSEIEHFGRQGSLSDFCHRACHLDGKVLGNANVELTSRHADRDLTSAKPEPIRHSRRGAAAAS
jgi:hypothetical protein